MVTKTITVTEDAYESIKSLKSKEESFSELFLRLSDQKMKIKDLFGILGKSEEEAKLMQQRLKQYRQKFSKDAEERRH
ncbi:MAG TPA: antitoxin VapB family protein, partial [Candidatus Nanoarchaeia archaeon]|nr:antitoxin VapB family protein [Candidatus Nanoarchaeia archaeon]